MNTSPCWSRTFFAALATLAISLPLSRAHAGSATWSSAPSSGDWNTAVNWTPATVPNGLFDTASFGSSSTTAVSLSASVQVLILAFNSGASPYTITAPAGTVFTLGGATNNSGIEQELVASQGSAAAGGIIYFSNGSAPALSHFTIQPGSTIIGAGFPSPNVQFHGVSSGGSATFDIEGTLQQKTDAAHATFYDSSSAGAGTYTIHASTVANGTAADIHFNNSSNAGSAIITGQAAGFAGALGGSVTFAETASAGGSTITINGGRIAGALHGLVLFSSSTTAGSATLIANGGVGQGGAISFTGNSLGGTSRIELLGNGYLDISLETLPSLTIGSLEGEGPAFLGSRNLIIGSNSLNTTYSGILQDGGVLGDTGASVTKVGTGALTLSGASTYTGATTVSAGSLAVANRTGSATGPGAVHVNAGILGGKGTIAGPVTIGTGSGAGATLMPEVTSSQQVTTTTQGLLTFNSDSTYSYRVNSSRGTADSATANGVVINGGQFVFRDKGHVALPSGTTFTAIHNTAATPIAGAFSNLADGSTLVVGSNSYLVSYEGGDGNDLTLTVVP